MGVKVTVLSSVFAHNRMTKASSQTLAGLNFVSFSDGYDDGFKLSDNHEHFRSKNKCHGSKALSELIKANSEEGFLITDLSDNAFGETYYQKSRDYVECLDLKLQSLVVYISFGSFFNLQLQEMEEIARRALVDGEKQEDKLSCKEKLEKQGLIEPWCSQVEVFSHPSVGCFVTHCGWNFTLESLVLGIPVTNQQIGSFYKMNSRLG
ncbi:hypothetical protein HYC85_019623 [Camellia sinensis]|uniref:Uncharacterized protein n=1 Tax=Camellia sinensis TaxID=4442 RepID=A0A7J7GQ08_CAMSI|nr:hypothetical protein HYC85_019623 [Camellia sinensis]